MELKDGPQDLSAKSLRLCNCKAGENSWESCGQKRYQTTQSWKKSTGTLHGGTDAELEEPIVWPSEAKSQITGKDPEAGKDLVQEDKGTKEDSSVLFSSVIQSCTTLCDPMDRNMPGVPALHQLAEFIQTHAHWISDAIKQSHPLSSPSPPTLNLCQHQGLFIWVSSLHQVAKVLEFRLLHQSFQWTPRTDFL